MRPEARSFAVKTKPSQRPMLFSMGLPPFSASAVRRKPSPASDPAVRSSRSPHCALHAARFLGPAVNDLLQEPIAVTRLKLHDVPPSEAKTGATVLVPCKLEGGLAPLIDF
jgi:hypothetical protein